MPTVTTHFQLEDLDRKVRQNKEIEVLARTIRKNKGMKDISITKEEGNVTIEHDIYLCIKNILEPQPKICWS